MSVAEKSNRIVSTLQPKYSRRKRLEFYQSLNMMPGSKYAVDTMNRLPAGSGYKRVSKLNPSLLPIN
jgi:hypothetical protein